MNDYDALEFFSIFQVKLPNVDSFHYLFDIVMGVVVMYNTTAAIMFIAIH
jgi:hypothetical protein